MQQCVLHLHGGRGSPAKFGILLLRSEGPVHTRYKGLFILVAWWQWSLNLIGFVIRRMGRVSGVKFLAPIIARGFNFTRWHLQVWLLALKINHSLCLWCTLYEYNYKRLQSFIIYGEWNRHHTARTGGTEVSPILHLPEAPPLENTDYMFSVRPEFFGRKDCKRHVLCNPS
jgi:hypothetical protein